MKVVLAIPANDPSWTDSLWLPRAGDDAVLQRCLCGALLWIVDDEKEEQASVCPLCRAYYKRDVGFFELP